MKKYKKFAIVVSVLSINPCYMADTLTPLQVRVLSKLRKDSLAFAENKSLSELYSAAQCALVLGIDERSFYRILESLENKKMISWKNHKFKNLRVLKRGFDCKQESVYECQEPVAPKEPKKENNDWAMGFMLFLVAGLIVLFGLIKAIP